ncbi:PfkB family carbohydrate kinase [Rhodopirellula sallentina]|uniref:Carbohydrate/purine kinase domain protein n=1 Tax=Rhodopirellula sallentina SM41 TaxID=1263870 RepID=M5UG99_9BACT|nr:PfkB family carbohydrate kinase [Rhodopirellula sallentina]EMI56866.1 Carbohydrate/purine kinase domain protein [Rhodopirellula sallentina SM41]
MKNQEHYNACETLADFLAERESTLHDLPVVMGFDAFVDESIRIVGQRHSPESYQPMPTIADFGAWAAAATGRSGLREFVCEEVTAGGCTVNMGDGIATMGIPLVAFSGVGNPPHSVFHDFMQKCEVVYSLGMDPGRAIVTEFDDGKLMFCAVSHFANVTPNYLREQFADGVFRAACERASGIAFTSWSVYPYMTQCWNFLVEEVFAGMTHRPHFFFDLADPASRTTESLVEMVHSLEGFETVGRATLSVNGNEANQIGRAFGWPEGGQSAETWEQLANRIREEAGISEVSIHLVDSATSATPDELQTVGGPFCVKPKRSVGAGDRFNAGYLAGLLLDLNVADRLRLGCASSGFLVRQGKSASWQELIEFLRRWAIGEIEN